MTDSQIWFIVAIVLFILEIVTPGFVLANFGVGAVGAAIAAWFGASMMVQFVVFAIVCFISFVTLRPIMKKTLMKGKGQAQTGAAALVGRTVKVTERIPGDEEIGRVQIDGDSWRAISADLKPIENHVHVKVVRVESTTVFVERL